MDFGILAQSYYLSTVTSRLSNLRSYDSLGHPTIYLRYQLSGASALSVVSFTDTISRCLQPISLIPVWVVSSPHFIIFVTRNPLLGLDLRHNILLVSCFCNNILQKLCQAVTKLHSRLTKNYLLQNNWPCSNTRLRRTHWTCCLKQSIGKNSYSIYLGYS